MAIVVGGIGAFVGVMTKLYLEEPEIFQRVMSLLATVLPFVLAIGTVLWVGFRRKPAKVNPLCSHCNHVLHDVDPAALVCPECGKDLSQAGSIEFAANPQSRWGLFIWGVAIFLMPVGAGLGLLLLLPSGNPLKALNNRRLIQNRLPAKVAEPWIWNELEDRVKRGRLTKQEATAAVKELILHMKATRPAGWDQPLTWQDDFLMAAANAKLIEEDVYFDLCDTFQGANPKLTLRPKLLPKGTNSFEIEVKYGTPWEYAGGVGADLVWEVKQVMIDGKPVKHRSENKFGQGWHGYYDLSLDAGDHPVTVELDCAYVNSGRLKGLNASQLPASKWPTPLKQWTKTVSGTLQVESLNAQ